MTGGPPPSQLLAIYLRHHVAASGAGLDLFRRAARKQSDDAARHGLRALAGEVAQDRASLVGILADLGVQRKSYQERVVSFAETVAGLKPNGTVWRRSPLSDVVELEALGVALQAKKLGWLALRRLSQDDDRLRGDQLDQLIRRAADQQDRVEELRRQAVARTFTPTTG